ncbi:MAG: tRNA-dihydrouridine synthase family protein [Bacteroidales bacterium]|jgi:tRNA-dihydrouridine synthase
MGFEINFLGPKVKVENTFVFDTRLWTSKDRLIMAPLHTLTEHNFRNAFIKAFPDSIDKIVAPFISLSHGSIKSGNRKYRDVLKENNNNGIDLIPQVLGNDINGIIEVANVLFSMGYNEMNLNLGCPFKKITNKNRGAALLKDTDKIEEIIKEIIDKTQINVSLKIRLGYDTRDDIYRLIPVINSYPISNIIIHPRLGVDEYNSEVDLDSFEDVSKLIRKRIIYNGDIFRVEDFNRLKLRFPQINDWMIGRGLLYNPLLPSEIKGINYVDKKERLLAFHSLLVESVKSVNKLKEYWTYFAKGLYLEDEKLNQLLKTETIEELDKLARELL